jgi:hypothetical protein
MRGTLTACLVVALAALAVSAGSASASARVTKAQYIAKGDAICGTAIVQLRRLGYLRGGRAAVASRGKRWLAIDRRTLAALRRLTPPAADRARVKRLLGLGDVAINKGVVGAIEAAKNGSNAGYSAAARRATAMINRAHAAARAYGFRVCPRW